MQKAKPKVTAPKLNPLDSEFLTRQQQFVSEARCNPMLQPYLIENEPAAINQIAGKKRAQKSFVDLILMVLQNKPNSMDVTNYIKQVIFQQNCWNKDSLQPLAESFSETKEQRIQDEILMEIFKRANTCALKTMEILLAEPSKKSAEELHIAAKYPDIYAILKNAEQALVLQIEDYIGQGLLNKLSNKIKEIEYNQAPPDQKFHVAKELAVMTYTPNKRDIGIDTDIRSEKKEKSVESTSPAKKLLSLFSGSKKVEESPSPPSSSTATPRRPSLFASSSSVDVDELNKAVKKRSNTINTPGNKGAR